MRKKWKPTYSEISTSFDYSILGCLEGVFCLFVEDAFLYQMELRLGYSSVLQDQQEASASAQFHMLWSCVHSLCCTQAGCSDVLSA